MYECSKMKSKRVNVKIETSGNSTGCSAQLAQADDDRRGTDRSATSEEEHKGVIVMTNGVNLYADYLFSLLRSPSHFSHPTRSLFFALRSPSSIFTFSAIHADPLLVSSLSRLHRSQASRSPFAIFFSSSVGFTRSLKILLASLLTSLLALLSH